MDIKEKKLNDEALDQVTGGTGYDDIVPIDEDPFPWLRKHGNNDPAGGNSDPPPADDRFGEPGESPW